MRVRFSKFLALFLAFSLLLASLSVSTVRADFLDIPANSDIYPAANYYQKTGIITGKPDGLFHPELPVTRAEFLKILIGNIDEDEDLSYISVLFPDVPKGSWFEPFVKVALKRAILKSSTENFNPQGPITWLEAVQYLYRTYYRVPLPKVVTSVFQYSDFNKNLQPSEHAKVAQALEDGLLLPVSSDQLGLYRSPTRGETLGFLYKARGLYQYTLKGDVGELEQELFNKVDPKLKQILLDVYDLVHSEYLRQEDIDDEALIYNAIRGYVEGLEDPYSGFYPPVAAEELQNHLDGDDFEGIGATIDTYAGQIRVIAPIKDSPADKAGMREGDVIVAIDGEETLYLSLQEVVHKIRGPKGTTVKITVQRIGTSDPIELSIVRDVISVAPVEFMSYPGNVAYFRLTQFVPDLPDQFKKVYDQNIQTKPAGLVLDVRNNPGGSLNAVAQMCSFIAQKDDILLSLRDHDEREIVQVHEDGFLAGIPLVVLVNKGSASASEILAACVQDNQRGTIIGERTYGKGVVQRVYDLDNNSILKLTISEWLTPKGNSVHKKGVMPDKEVKADPNDRNNDLPLKEALRTLGY